MFDDPEKILPYSTETNEFGVIVYTFDYLGHTWTMPFTEGPFNHWTNTVNTTKQPDGDQFTMEQSLFILSTMIAVIKDFLDTGPAARVRFHGPKQSGYDTIYTNMTTTAFTPEDGYTYTIDSSWRGAEISIAKV